MEFPMSKEEFNKKWSAIVARAWEDENFKKKLLKNPRQVLKEEGLIFPEHAKIVMEEGAKTSYTLILSLPKKPKRELTETELRRVSAAGNVCNSTWCGDG